MTHVRDIQIQKREAKAINNEGQIVVRDSVWEAKMLIQAARGECDLVGWEHEYPNKAAAWMGVTAQLNDWRGWMGDEHIDKMADLVKALFRQM